MIGLVVTTVVGFVFFEIGKSDGVKEAEEKRISQCLLQDSQAVAENKIPEIDDKFARMLKELAAERRGFERGFREVQRVDLQKVRELKSKQD